jgi:hypothetical protein
VSTASRDLWESPFRDSARGVTRGRIPGCRVMIRRKKGLAEFGPL